MSATLELLADSGYHALSVESVAARAGVGKATIYRRWAGKKELVAEALASLNADLPPPPVDGTIRERLLVLMVHVCDAEPFSMQGRIMHRMFAYQSSHPELFTEFLRRVLVPRRERLHRVLRDGMASGELRPGLDVELVGLALTSPLLMMQKTHPDRDPVPADAQTLLDLLWPGIATRPAPPQPRR